MDGRERRRFWRSVNLTGNQTIRAAAQLRGPFWRSVNLTGNQTEDVSIDNDLGFGAVSI